MIKYLFLVSKCASQQEKVWLLYVGYDQKYNVLGIYVKVKARSVYYNSKQTDYIGTIGISNLTTKISNCM